MKITAAYAGLLKNTQTWVITAPIVDADARQINPAQAKSPMWRPETIVAVWTRVRVGDNAWGEWELTGRCVSGQKLRKDGTVATNGEHANMYPSEEAFNDWCDSTRPTGRPHSFVTDVPF